MRGWQPQGEAFRRLVNQNSAIPREASRVHGYTREILERDGKPPEEVYQEFAEFVSDLPLCSYNLAYDLDNVLIPEWRRLGIPVIGKRGFCLLRLTQRLLDPSPAGNCQLQTLRQFYRLPEHGAHTALGDVRTCVDLMAKVLHFNAEKRGLRTWDEIFSLTLENWSPARDSLQTEGQASAIVSEKEAPRIYTSESLWNIAKGAAREVPSMYRDRAVTELHARLMESAEQDVQQNGMEFRPLAVIDKELPIILKALGFGR